MTIPHGGPQDLAGPADDRPLTYNDAGTVYQASLTAARGRYAELSDRDLNARTAALLRERGEFDPANLGHQLVAASEPLSAAEHLEHTAAPAGDAGASAFLRGPGWPGRTGLARRVTSAPAEYARTPEATSACPPGPDA
jgi:hypothetical protein